MAPFWQDKRQGYTIIVGCGRLGANLANSLSDAGQGVMVIDIDAGSFSKLSPDYSGLTLVGDATLLSVLHDAEIEKATAVISVTNYDNTNILVAQVAKELYGIEHVIARLYDPDRECVYQDFGIDTISPAVLSMKEINKLLRHPDAEGASL
jgi:trk system potassium uptake protein TrkA